MGHSALVVLVKGRRALAFDDRWLGARVLDLLREGPAAAERDATTLRPVSAIRDDYEAGWLLDGSRRRLLVYGDPTTGYVGEEAPPAPLPVDELRRRFPGYTVVWLDDAAGLRRHLDDAGVEVDEPVEALEDEVRALEEELARRVPPSAPASPPPATAPPSARRPRVSKAATAPFFVVLALVFVPALLVRLLLLPVREQASAWVGERRRRRELLARRRALRDRLDGRPVEPSRPVGLVAFAGFLFLALAGLADE